MKRLIKKDGKYILVNPQLVARATEDKVEILTQNLTIYKMRKREYDEEPISTNKLKFITNEGTYVVDKKDCTRASILINNILFENKKTPYRVVSRLRKAFTA